MCRYQCPFDLSLNSSSINASVVPSRSCHCVLQVLSHSTEVHVVFRPAPTGDRPRSSCCVVRSLSRLVRLRLHDSALTSIIRIVCCCYIWCVCWAFLSCCNRNASVSCNHRTSCIGISCGRARCDRNSRVYPTSYTESSSLTVQRCDCGNAFCPCGARATAPSPSNRRV